MDDFILLATSKKQLAQWQEQIVWFLAEALQLTLNSKVTRIDSIFNGVDFVGYIARPHYLLCRRRVIAHCKEKLEKYQKQLIGETANATIVKFDADTLDNLLATVNSYLGHFGHARTRKIIRQIYAQFPFLRHYFYLTPRRVIRRYKVPRKTSRLKHQVWFYQKRFQYQILLFQVGCYFEAYGRSAIKLHKLFGYQLRKKWRGLYFVCGFHQKWLARVCEQLEQKQQDYMLFRQTERHLLQTMERVPYLKVEFYHSSQFGVPSSELLKSA